MSAEETICFHLDRRGRIVIENVTGAAIALARALAPEDPALARLVAAAGAPEPRRNSDVEKGR